jgi:hypothetical protein
MKHISKLSRRKFLLGSAATAATATLATHAERAQGQFNMGAFFKKKSAPNNLSLSTAISKAGLNTGLKVCLDAGASSSYSGSGQIWNDLSGNGHHFYLGSSSAVVSSEPVFQGTAGGLSKNECFYSGFQGRGFTLTESNPAWVAALHKDNAKFTICTWLKYRFSGYLNIARTGDGGTGMRLLIGTGSYVQYLVYNYDTIVCNLQTPEWIVDNKWTFVGFSYDEVTGDGRFCVARPISVGVDSVRFHSASGIYNPAPIGSAISTLFIHSDSDMNSAAMHAIWSGQAFSNENFQSIFDSTKSRFL